MINQELFNEFWRINYGDDSPTKIALRAVMAEMFAKWEVFKNISEVAPIVDVVDAPTVRYLTYKKNKIYKGGVVFENSFSDCWFLEFHNDGTVLKRGWHGEVQASMCSFDQWWFGSLKELSKATPRYSYNIELTKEDINKICNELKLGWSV